jgi:hypothetical protein
MFHVERPKVIMGIKKSEKISVRIDPERVALMRAKGINIRPYLENLIDQLLEQEVCPVCGHKIQSNKKKIA